MTKEKITQDFERYCKIHQGLSDNTIKAYIRDIKSFLLFFNIEEEKIKGIKILSTSDFKRWIVSKKNTKNNSNRSITRAISSIKCFINFLKEEKNLKNIEFFHLKSLKFSKSLPKAFNSDDVIHLIKSIDQLKKLDPWEIKRNKLILLIIFSTGMRISEALSLKIKDINEDNLRIIGKGNKERIVPLTNLIKEELKSYLLEVNYLIKYFNFSSESPLFFNKKGKGIIPRNIQLLLEKLRRNLGFSEDFTPHALRHSCATELLNIGLNIREIQKLLGHSNLSTTQIYTKISENHLKSELDKIDY